MLEDAFFQVVYPLFYIVLIGLYMITIVFKLDTRKSIYLTKIRHLTKYAIISYGGNEWKQKAGIMLAEAVSAIFIVIARYNTVTIKLIPIVVLLYIVINIYMSVVVRISKNIVDVLNQSIKDIEVVFIFMIPILVICGGLFVAMSVYDAIIQVGAYVMLAAFVVAYIKFQQILLYYVFYGYNLHNGEIDTHERRMSVLVFYLLVDMLILISGGLTLLRFFPNSFCERTDIGDVIYDIFIVFFTLGGGTVKVNGFMGKTYNFLIILASIIMFSCYLGYMLNKKNTRLEKKEEKEKEELMEKKRRKGKQRAIKKKFDNFLSAKLLLDISIQEYQNEHNRTSIIDTKTNIALPIIATYLFLILDKISISYYEKQVEAGILSLMDAELQFGIVIIAIILALASCISMFMTIKTDQYTILKLEDFYKPDYMALEEDKFAAAMISFVLKASNSNKRVNDERIKKYKFGLVMVGSSLLVYILYIIIS